MSGWQYSPGRLANVVDIADQPRPTADSAADDAAERAELIAHRQAVRRSRLRRLTTGVAGIVILLALWQVSAALLGDEVVLPTVNETVGQFVHYLGRPYPAQGKPLWFDLYISMRRILIGFVVGVTTGVAVGAAMSGWRFARH